MKRIWLLLLIGAALLGLAGCGSKIPDPVEESVMALDLPEEYLRISVDGASLSVQDISLEITDRQTDLERQVDDVDCQVELSGNGFSLTYPCTLHYAYVREQGWQVRSYELIGEPSLTLKQESYRQKLSAANEKRLGEELGYDSVTLEGELWDTARDSYTQTYSVEKSLPYLAENGTVLVSGYLERQGSGFDYVWVQGEDQTETSLIPVLEDTIWHYCSTEKRVEAAFQITDMEGDTLTLSGVVRCENWTGYVKEKPLHTDVTWEINEYGCISFTLPEQNDQRVTCNIQSDWQWVTFGDQYLGLLEAVSLPESGDLADLMELPTESWVDLLPHETETAETTPSQPEPEEDLPQPEPEEEEEPQETESGESLWDLIKSFFGF